jgi:hypothetical protein
VIHNDVKKAVENGDISSLKYFFCDCLDGDPTFTEYEEDYEYCRSKGVFFVPHTELHPMSCMAVDESYWVQLKKDFMQNPSIERMEHMREVAKILYSSRICKIEEDKARKAAKKSDPKQTHTESVKTALPHAKPVSKTNTQTIIQANPYVDGRRRAIEPVGQNNQPFKPSVDGGRIAKEPAGQKGQSFKSFDDGVRRAKERVGEDTTPQGTQPKKSNGVGRIALAVIAAVIVAIVAICLINK